MPDPGVLELAGARPTKPTKYTNLQTLKWIGGLQTQRSPMASIATRYDTRFLGGKPDSLYSGLNCEISNDLTLQRRPGLIPYSTASIPPPDFFYSWQQTSPPNISLLVDTASAVYDYTPTSATVVFNKVVGAGQTYFYDIADTVYMGDGIDLLKWSGHAIDNPSVAPTVTTIAGGTYPNRTYLFAYTYVTLNGETEISPITTLAVSANNLPVVQSPAPVTGAVGWNLYISPINNVIDLNKHNMSGILSFGTSFTEPIVNAGSSVAVPIANTTGNTVNWGIVGPTNAPTLANTALPNPYPSWAANTFYSPSLTIKDTNNNIQLLTTGGTTGSSQPTWNMTVGGLTNESGHGGTAVWTNQGPAAWVASTAYTVGDLVYVTFTVTINTGGSGQKPPINPKLPPPPPQPPTTHTITYNDVFMCTTAGTSGASAPTWLSGTGSVVSDGSNGLVWTNQGAQVTWTTIGASTLVSLNQMIADSNGNTETIITPGKSGATAPTWATAQGALTTDNTATWSNAGPVSISTGGGIYNYVYSFVNSATGQFSNASPIGGPIVLAPNSYITVQGEGSTDPQVDIIAIFRTVANGGFYYLDAYVLNTPTWTFQDTVPDLSLNTDVFAPLGEINSPPPAGLIDFEFFAGRMWGSVGPFLYYASSNDNATLLNIGFNGVSAESWSPINVIPFNAQIVRIINVSNTLWVFTTEDMWAVTGTNLTNFAPTKVLVGHGIRSYNALDTDGAVLYVYTGDQQFLSISPNAGSLEIGFPIGDTLQNNVSSVSAYVARHVAGSEDNAVYIADGSTGWYRLNPNQTGASASGEQAPVWSPNAQIQDGCGAVQSIEISFGIHKLLVGQTITGPVLMRDLATFTDNGTAYTWNAVIGSVVLAPPGELAEVESITVESKVVAVPVAILANEIAGTFENLNIGSNPVNDPPGYPASSSLFSKRYYLSEGTVPPIMRHTQVQVSGIAAATKDEVLTLTSRGVLVPEQA